MKKILCLVLLFAMLFSFVACGSESSDSNDGSTATLIKFSSETYEVKVDGYNMISNGIVIEPAGAKVVYEVSNTEIATISKKGEVTGVKEGTVTVTAKSEDGKVSATCTVVVKGFGSIAERDPATGEGGVRWKRPGAPEINNDTAAIIVIVSKNIDKSIDKTAITTLDYGTRNSDGYYIVSGEGFYVTRNNDTGNYLVEDVPSGDYVGLIICSHNYIHYKDYDNSLIFSSLKSSALGNVLSDAELSAIASNKAIQSREFIVKEFSVKTGETTVFAHDFIID